MSINDSQQLLEYFHCWSIIPLAHATFLIIYYSHFHSLPFISHNGSSCHFFCSLLHSEFAVLGPNVGTSSFLHTGRAAGAPSHFRWENSKGGKAPTILILQVYGTWEGRQQRPSVDCECHWPFYTKCIYHTIILYIAFLIPTLVYFPLPSILFWFSSNLVLVFPKKNFSVPFLKLSLFLW